MSALARPLLPTFNIALSSTYSSTPFYAYSELNLHSYTPFYVYSEPNLQFCSILHNIRKIIL